jgi:DNA-binding NtrC family response regulator
MPSNKKTEISHGKGKVLIMDDDEIFCNFIRRTLERLGYEVEIVHDGSKAIVSYRKAIESGYPFDVVIIDLFVQEGMGGKETMKNLLQIDPDVRAVISSGHTTDPLMVNYREYGFKGVVAKPFTIEELCKTLSDVMMSNE